MTLAKTKPSHRTTTQRKRSAMHHKRSSRYMRSYWPYLPIAAIVSLSLLFNAWIGGINKNVLGYATDMSIASLLNDTNTQRTANGLGSLALNGTLNQAAQAKAQDMMANDYWAHVSPTGKTPWYWITNAGYSYQTAGENLAYGFASAADTVTGWMNSPGHRANILNISYKEVGFGIVNAPSYQGEGNQTIVVAMYAEPYAVPAPIAKTTPTPTPTQTPAPTTTTQKTTTRNTAMTPAQQNTQQPASTPITTPVATTPIANNTATSKNTSTKKAENNQTSQAEPVSQQKITRVQLLSAANVAWSQFAISMIASVALLLFLLRHSFAWHRVIAKGERFVLHHPLLDIAFVTIASLSFILLQTGGMIR